MANAAHLDLPHANPFSSDQFDTLVRSIAAEKPLEVLDIGCGWGSFATALAQKCDASILAIDINEDSLSRAKALVAARELDGEIDFRNMPAIELTDKRYDAVVCIGSSHAFGAPPEALARCAGLMNPKGTLLFADLVWAAEPPQEFLDFLGFDRSTLWMESDANAVFAAAGLTIWRQEVTSAASWRTYEDAVHRGRLRFAETLATPEADEVRTRAADWRAARQRWGRHCLGFVGYLAVGSSRSSRDVDPI